MALSSVADIIDDIRQGKMVILMIDLPDHHRRAGRTPETTSDGAQQPFTT